LGAWLCDIASIPQAGDPSNLTWYQDGTHPTNALHAIIASVVKLGIEYIASTLT
jgi:hypothetical protein